MDEVLVDWIEETTVLTVAPVGLSLDGLLAASKVKRGTMGGELVERIWSAFFAHRRDLRQEYLSFYRLDYKSFEAFLYFKLDVPVNVIKFISSANTAETIVGLSAAGLGGGRGLVEWIKSEEGWESLEGLIKARRIVCNEAAD